MNKSHGKSQSVDFSPLTTHTKNQIMEAFYPNFHKETKDLYPEKNDLQMKETQSSDQNLNKKPDFKLKVEQKAPPIFIHTETKGSFRNNIDYSSEKKN